MSIHIRFTKISNVEETNRWHAALAFVMEGTAGVVLAKGISTQQTSISCCNVELSLGEEILQDGKQPCQPTDSASIEQADQLTSP